MKETIKRHLISAGVTFVGFFLFVFFGSIREDTFVLSKTTLLSAAIAGGIAGIRASSKIIYELAAYLIAKYKTE